MENRRIAVYGIIIATYTAISLLMGNFSFGMIQIRIAEVLLVLCLYDYKFIIPVTLGCFVTNLIGLISGMNPLFMDLFIGTIATLISAVCVYYLRNIRYKDLPLLSLLLPAIINGVFVGAELAFYFPMNIWILMAYVGIGEFLSVTVFGLIIYKPMGRAIEQFLHI